MLVDEAQAIELSGGQPGNALGHRVFARGTLVFIGRVRQTRRLLQS
jgi:hypothetical protein